MTYWIIGGGLGSGAGGSSVGVRDPSEVFLSNVGSDLFDGSRTAPVNTLARAIQIAQEHPGNSIIKCIGEHSLPATNIPAGINFDGPLATFTGQVVTFTGTRWFRAKEIDTGNDGNNAASIANGVSFNVPYSRGIVSLGGGVHDRTRVNIGRLQGRLTSLAGATGTVQFAVTMLPGATNPIQLPKAISDHMLGSIILADGTVFSGTPPFAVVNSGSGAPAQIQTQSGVDLFLGTYEILDHRNAFDLSPVANNIIDVGGTKYVRFQNSALFNSPSLTNPGTTPGETKIDIRGTVEVVHTNPSSQATLLTVTVGLFIGAEPGPPIPINQIVRTVSTTTPEPNEDFEIVEHVPFQPSAIGFQPVYLAVKFRQDSGVQRNYDVRVAIEAKTHTTEAATP